MEITVIPRADSPFCLLVVVTHTTPTIIMKSPKENPPKKGCFKITPIKTEGRIQTSAVGLFLTQNIDLILPAS